MKQEINEAIILAGGLGTRLRTIISDKPKPLAEIAGKPFLEYLLDLLIYNKIKRVIFAVAYMHESIEEHFINGYRGLDIDFAIEETNLDTGGAMLNALSKAHSQRLLILNGDSFCFFDLKDLESTFEGALLQLTGLSIDDISRYGALEVENQYLKGFHEKGKAGNGLINAGIYLVDKIIFSNYYKVGSKFSFEKDFIPQFLKQNKVKVSIIQNKYFIDIGTAEDYYRASQLLATLKFEDNH